MRLFTLALILLVEAIHSTANPAYTADELHYQLTTVKTSLLLVHPAVLYTALVAAKKAGISADRLVLFERLPKSISASSTAFQDLITEGLRKDPSFVERHLNPGEAKTKIAFLCFSSGTTGRPKVRERTLDHDTSANICDMQAVAIPHYAVIANIIQYAVFLKVNDPSIPWDDLRYRPGDISTCVLPLFREFIWLYREQAMLSWLQISMAWLSTQVS